jgi:hypothetical protein
MRRQRTSLAALTFALAAALLPSVASAQQASMRGTWTLNRQASDNIATAINAAVGRMNFVTRPIARGRLTRTNAPYARVEISYTQERVTLKFDERAPMVTPSNGTPIQWRREDGEMFALSTEWENGRLEQTFRAEDGQRVNVFSVSEDGNTLTLNVTVSSPRLPQPLRYKLVYNRAS